MQSARERLVRYVYTCSAISLATGVYGPLATSDWDTRTLVLVTTSIVITTTAAIIAMYLDRRS